MEGDKNRGTRLGHGDLEMGMRPQCRLAYKCEIGDLTIILYILPKVALV